MWQAGPLAWHDSFPEPLACVDVTRNMTDIERAYEAMTEQERIHSDRVLRTALHALVFADTVEALAALDALRMLLVAGKRPTDPQGAYEDAARWGD